MMTSGCSVIVHRNTSHTQLPHIIHTHTTNQAGVWLSNISIIMSGQSEPTSTGDKLLQAPEQVWTTLYLWYVWNMLDICFLLVQLNHLVYTVLCLVMAKLLILSNIQKCDLLLLWSCSSRFYFYHFCVHCLAFSWSVPFLCEILKPEIVRWVTTVLKNCTQTLSHMVQMVFSRCHDYES